MKIEREAWSRWADILICTVLGGTVFFLAARYLLPILLPFLIAWLVSLSVARPARRIAERLHLPQKLCAAVLFFIILMLAVFLVGLAVSRALSELGGLLTRLLDRYGSFENMASEWIGCLAGEEASASAFRDHFYGMVSDMLSGAVSAIAERLPSVAARVLSAFPSILFGTVVTVMAGFYFCVDGERIRKATVSLLPRAIREELPRWRERFRRVSWRYVKAYLILMVLIFSVLLVGFLVLGVPYALLLASLIALADMLPVLGVGTALIPWAAVMLLRGERYLGFGLLILYAVAALVRQIAEPRLIGKSLGLHPFLTLVATYLGWKLGGVLGMLLSPILALIVKAAVVQRSETKKMIDKREEL